MAEHRISADDEKTIMQYIEGILTVSESATETEKAEVTEKQKKFEDFLNGRALKKYSAWYYDSPTKQRRLSYESLPVICDICGIGYIDLLTAASTRCGQSDDPMDLPRWPSEHSEKMAALLPKLSEEQLHAFAELVENLTPQLVRDVEAAEESDSAGFRIFKVYQLGDAVKGASKEKVIDKGFEKTYQYVKAGPSYNKNTIPLGMLPRACSAFGVSLHWALALGEDVPVLCRNGYEESLMDHFCLMPFSWQETLANGYELALENYEI